MQFFKTLIQLYLFYLFLCFWLTVSKRVSTAIVLYIKFKIVGLWVDTAWNRGIPCIILTFLIKLYLVILNGSKRLSEVRSFEMQWICRPIRQIQPETGESLVIFQNTDPIVFVLFISLFLTYCIKEGIKGNIFGHYI